MRMVKGRILMQYKKKTKKMSRERKKPRSLKEKTSYLNRLELVNYKTQCSILSKSTVQLAILSNL